MRGKSLQECRTIVEEYPSERGRDRRALVPDSLRGRGRIHVNAPTSDVGTIGQAPLRLKGSSIPVRREVGHETVRRHHEC